MPRGSRTLTRALSVALLSSAVLTACVPFGTDADAERLSAGPSAATTSTSSPTAPAAPLPAPTPSVSPAAYPPLGPLPDGVAPARPAALDGPPTLDGAKAVATYFLLLYPYVYQSGDLDEWNRLSHGECNFCASVRDHVGQAQAAHQHTVGGAFLITAVTGTEVNPGKFFDLHLTVEGSPSRVVTSTGLVLHEQTAGNYATSVVVVFDAGSWRVRGVEPDQAR